MTEMRKNKLLTPKAIEKTVSEWTARIALLEIGYASAVKKKTNQRCPKKIFKNWPDFIKTGASMIESELFGPNLTVSSQMENSTAGVDPGSAIKDTM